MEFDRRVHGEKSTTKLTVPSEVRQELGIDHGDRVTLRIDGHETEVRVGSRGYITIPKAVAEDVGIDPYDEMTFEIET